MVGLERLGLVLALLLVAVGGQVSHQKHPRKPQVGGSIGAAPRLRLQRPNNRLVADFVASALARRRQKGWRAKSQAVV